MRRPGILLTIAIAWTAVVLGHLVAYLLTYPSQGFRHLHLAVTGHSWLGLAAASMLAVIPVILLTVGVRSLRAPAGWSGGVLALRLAAIQVPAFLLIEIVEREWSIGRAISDPAVFVGLMLQPLVAVIAACVLELFARAVRAIVALLRPPRPYSPRSFPRPGLKLSAPRPWAFLPARRRAPPFPTSP
ncbi:MAG: hypothetical protein ACRDHM_06080 [Actinomycetota bacterium]